MNVQEKEKKESAQQEMECTKIQIKDTSKKCLDGHGFLQCKLAADAQPT